MVGEGQGVRLLAIVIDRCAARTLNGCTTRPLCLSAAMMPTDSDVFPTPEWVPAITTTCTIAASR